MEEKKIFSSLTDLYAFIKKYEEEHYVQLNKAECKKLVGKSLETRCPRALNANKNLIYYNIRYRCVHGRKYTYQGNNKRQSRTLRGNCPMNINIKLTKDGNALEISSLNETHNHEISKDFYLSLPKQRKLNIEEQKVVKHLLQLKYDKKLVKAYVKTTYGKLITLRDLTNCKRSLSSNHTESSSSSFNVSGIEMKKLKKNEINVLTNNEKYKKTIAIGKEIAGVLSTYGTKDFYEQYGQLKYFCDLLSQRKNILVVEVDNDIRSPINNMNDIADVTDVEPSLQTAPR